MRRDGTRCDRHERSADLDQVTAIPDSVLRRNDTIDHWSLPFRIVVQEFLSEFPPANVE